MNEFLQNNSLAILGALGTIGLFAIGLIMAWTKINDRLDAIDGENGRIARNERKMDELKHSSDIVLKENNLIFTQIKVDLAEVKTSQDFIKTQLVYLTEKLK
jgi:hypothetical protein